MSKFKLTMFSLFLLLRPAVASAEFTVENYHQFKGSEARFDDYLTGIGKGIFWANTVLGVEGHDKMFCIPPGASWDQGIILSVIDQEIRSPTYRDSWDSDVLIELIAVHAFKNKFPCP